MLRFWLKENFINIGVLFFVSVGFGGWGLGWGLPSSARRDLFLDPSLNNPDFFSQLASVRSERYEKMGFNGAAYAGRLERSGQTFDSPSDIRHCYGSFILRSHDADEQQTLVAISRLNPLKGQWYPHAYYYGGAYIYSSAAFLGFCKAIGLIKLVPDITFYYANPEAMANIFRSLRAWSVIGLFFSGLCLYLLAFELSKRKQLALWASFTFVLLPACLTFAKVGKPHVWVPGWTFLSLLFMARFARTQRVLDIFMGGVLMGCALGTAMSQWVFLPAFFIVGWNGSFKDRFIAVIFAVGLSGLFFLLFNPTLPFHFHDFQDEVSFISHWYPFKIRIPAVIEVLWRIVRPAMTILIWLTGLIGVAIALIVKNNAIIRKTAWALFCATVLVAFQLQSTTNDPLQARIFLPGLGLLSFFAVWLTHEFEWGRYLRWCFAAVLIFRAVILGQHFRMDRVPTDNAAHASAWIEKNIPKGSLIQIIYSIPTVDQIPPIPFFDYKFVSRKSADATHADYIVINGRRLGIEGAFNPDGFKLVETFDNSPLNRWGLTDVFSNANFPVLVYKRSAQ